MSDKAIQAKEKKEVSTPAEPTKPGPVFKPTVDIFENDTEITLLADIPGVRTDDLAIDLREDTITLTGDVKPPESEGESYIFKEYSFGKYFRQFTLSEVIDQSKIEANLKDGVLRVKLPKIQKAAPRKITVSAA